MAPNNSLGTAAPSNRCEALPVIPFRVRIGVVWSRLPPDSDTFRAQVRVAVERVRSVLAQQLQACERTPIAFGVVTPLLSPAARRIAQVIIAQSDPTTPATEREPIEELPEWRIVRRCDVLLAIMAKEDEHSGAAQLVHAAHSHGRVVIAVSPTPPHDVTFNQPGSTENRPLDDLLACVAATEKGIARFNSSQFPDWVEAYYCEKRFAEMFARPPNRPAKAIRLWSAFVAAARRMTPSIPCWQETDEVADAAKQVIRERLMPAFVRADLMAIYYQWLYVLAGVSVYCLVPLSVGALAVATQWLDLSRRAYAVELLFLGTIYALTELTHRRRVRRLWIESRFLAERLRSAIFLVAAGAERTPLSVAAPLPEAPRPETWMLLAFREIWNRVPPLRPCWGVSAERVRQFLCRVWPEGQMTFHDKKRIRTEFRNWLFEVLGKAAFLTAIALAAGHLLLAPSHDHPVWYAQALTVIAIMLPAAGASINGIRTHREYSRVSKRSEVVLEQLADLREQLDYASTPEGLAEVLQDIEDIVLADNQEWLLLMGTLRLHAA